MARNQPSVQLREQRGHYSQIPFSVLHCLPFGARPGGRVYRPRIRFVWTRPSASIASITASALKRAAPTRSGSPESLPSADAEAGCFSRTTGLIHV